MKPAFNNRIFTYLAILFSTLSSLKNFCMNGNHYFEIPTTTCLCNTRPAELKIENDNHKALCYVCYKCKIAWYDSCRNKNDNIGKEEKYNNFFKAEKSFYTFLLGNGVHTIYTNKYVKETHVLDVLTSIGYKNIDNNSKGNAVSFYLNQNQTKKNGNNILYFIKNPNNNTKI